MDDVQINTYEPDPVRPMPLCPPHQPAMTIYGYAQCRRCGKKYP